MNNVLVNNLKSSHLVAPLPTDEALRLADEVLNNLIQMHVYPQSIVFINQAAFFLGQRNADKYLGIVSPNKNVGTPFEGQQESSTIDKHNRLRINMHMGQILQHVIRQPKRFIGG